MSAHTYPMPGVLDDTWAPQPVASSAPYWGRRLLAVVVLAWAASFVIGFETALTVLTLVGYGAAVLGIRRPALGLLGIGVLATIDAPARALLFTGGLLRYNTFNYWLLVVMLLSIPFLLKLRDPQTRLLQAFVLLLGLQLAATSGVTGGVEGIHSVLSIVTAFGLLVYFAAVLHDRQAWYWLGLVCGAVSALGGLAFFLQLDRLPYVNPNAWAFFPLTGLFAICMAFPFATEMSRGRVSLQSVAVMNLAVVNLAWVFLSASRGVLSIAAVCFVYLVLAVRGMPRRLTFLVVAGLLAFALSVQFAQSYDWLLYRVGRLFDPTFELVNRTSGRSDLVLGGWHIFLKNPFGVGTGGFKSAWAGLGDLGGKLTFGRTGIETAAHSGWIKVLAENGIVGFLLLAAYVLSFAAVAWRRRRSRDLFLLGMLTTAVMTVAFVSTEFQGKGLWFLAAGVTTLLHGLDLRVGQRADFRPTTPAGPPRAQTAEPC